jgi:hypothetical protein
MNPSLNLNLRLSLSTAEADRFAQSMTRVNALHTRHFSDASYGRQPVHSVYGGAQLFKAGYVRKLGDIALASLRQYAATPAELAAAMGIDMDVAQIDTLYARVLAKLHSEPVEDMRIDFEDGYGHRPDAEEDTHAAAAASELAMAMTMTKPAGALSPFVGLRIKSFADETRARAIRTLDIFLSTLVAQAGGVPDNFLVTLPKVTCPEQVAIGADLLDRLEDCLGLPSGRLQLDVMVETPQLLLNHQGQCALPELVRAARGRCRSVAFGTYDYTAACGITAIHQSHTHASADFARHLLQVSLAGTGVALSDGATTAMPIGPHRAPVGGKLTAAQLQMNRAVVHGAWRLHFENVMHSLRHGYYQGWDLNPAQFPARYAAVIAYFLGGLPDATARLAAFLDRAAQASLHGSQFDDAATGQGLLNFFLRGQACGALGEAEVRAAGLSTEELRSRSFAKIVRARAAQSAGA